MAASANQMPQFPEPYWREITFPSFEKLTQNLAVDVAIVGGGITGITAGFLLKQEGLHVAILEAGNILNGTTGHTTAKITAQHNLIYDELIHHFGEEQARLYYQSADDSLQFIIKMIQEKGIDCDFSKEDAYLYAITDEYADKIEKENEAYQRLHINGNHVSSIPFDIPITGALVMKEQAQFHPLKYLKTLAKDFIAAGGLIFENTTAIDIEEGDTPTVMTRDGHRVSCKYLIMASHFPFFDKKGMYFTRMYAERSYAIGIKAKKDYPGGMYLSVDEPSRSLRYTPVNGEPLMIVGGESHKTGQGPDTLLHYLALESFADVHFGIEEYKYRWSTQDLITIDKLPYIGEITADNPRILTATGFRKWGMTNGTTAARLLSDMILEKENPYQKLFSPTRHFKADPSIKKLITINADVAGHLLKGKLEYVGKDPNDLHHDEGAVVMVNGKRAGAYKDTEGILHIVDTTCTHLGCECEWNHGERTWDCPCHGSRYSIDGEVLDGPTHKPLKKIDF
ncbi:FAD-dependent oxidoreductase [Bacillus benzoevorans]|uniref:Glycine/D-amino acid oxidase-like deaminating enzyme/nitrite reductase/ring-hydroxylating ferredoxin subunit n=1 Tax=Bacillus benzoevorans TaxID=1456 RepID=A0A7X0HUZ2_9BACI|nr:FAD-dependent oxidoreductase [Bacillus benzoevorans]MBB6447323.1 glycine/D-amino acid oxidase-like deaminating enzyme/nitrite reductase/ring-hydroxylating ferredoxin subunit [Bacillus benzoevorans]